QLLFAFLREDAIADLLARLVEGERLDRRGRLELEDLIAPLRPKRRGDIANLHSFERLAKIRTQIARADWTDEPAVGARGRLRHFGRQLVEVFARRYARPQLIRLRMRGFVVGDADSAPRIHEHRNDNVAQSDGRRDREL